MAKLSLNVSVKSESKCHCLKWCILLRSNSFCELHVIEHEGTMISIRGQVISSIYNPFAEESSLDTWATCPLVQELVFSTKKIINMHTVKNKSNFIAPDVICK